MFDFIEFALSHEAVSSRQLLELKIRAKEASSKIKDADVSGDDRYTKQLELAARKEGLSLKSLNAELSGLGNKKVQIVGAPYWISKDCLSLATMSAKEFGAIFRDARILASGFPFLTLEATLSFLALGKSQAVGLLAAYFRAYGAWLEKSGGTVLPKVGITLEVYEASSSGTQMSTLEIEGSDWLSSLSPLKVLEFMEMSGANADWREQSHGYLKDINPKAVNFLFAATRQEALREDSGLEVFVRLTDKRQYFDWLLSQKRSKDLAQLFVEYLLLVVQGKNTDSWRFHFEGYAGLSPEACFSLARFYSENHRNDHFEGFARSLIDPFSETSKEAALC